MTHLLTSKPMVTDVHEQRLISHLVRLQTRLFSVAVSACVNDCSSLVPRSALSATTLQSLAEAAMHPWLLRVTRRRIRCDWTVFRHSELNHRRVT